MVQKEIPFPIQKDDILICIDNRMFEHVLTKSDGFSRNMKTYIAESNEFIEYRGFKHVMVKTDCGYLSAFNISRFIIHERPKY